MGVATAGIRIRASQTNTVAGFIETANSLFKLVEDAGMLRVSDADYSGQAGRLVPGPPGSGETQITALGTVSGNGVNYFNVYKHPKLRFYIRINVIEAGFSGSTSRWASINYSIFFDLNGSGSHDPSGYFTYQVQAWTTSGAPDLSNTGLPADYKNTYVSVADDHFWIGSAPHNYPNFAASYTGFMYRPGKSIFGFGVFADTDGAGSLAVVIPAYSTNHSSSSFSWGNTETSTAFNNAYQYTATRYWTYEPGAKVALSRGGAAAGFILDAAVPASGSGTRVQQAQLYINGVLRKFNFGFIAEAAVVDEAVIEVNLSGVGVKKYRVIKGFGPANPGISGYSSSTSYDTTSNSCPIFPWNAP